MYNKQSSRAPRRGFGAARSSFGGGRAGQDNGYQKRRMASEKLEFGSDSLASGLPFKKRKPFGERSSSFGERNGGFKKKEFGGYSEGRSKPYGERSERRGDRTASLSERPRRFSDTGSKPFGEKSSRFEDRGPRKSYGAEDRPKRFEDRGPRKSYGFDDKPNSFENKSEAREEKAFSSEERPRRFEGERREERSFGGDRPKRFGDRGPRGRRSDRGGRSGGGSRRGKSGPNLAGTKISIDQLINKVNDEAFIKPTEHVIEHEFKDFEIDSRLLDNITKKGYISPSPIQDQSIPVGLTGKDVIGIANTGTGKTAAFLIPLINKVLADRTQKAIIVTPTRELAVQIADELKGFVTGMNINSVLCIGGSNIRAQAQYIRSPFNFLIGTPGRIIDLCNRKMLFLDRFSSVVLDEADRMVDMGFINDIKFILGKLPKVRHSLFYTATLEPSVEGLIREFLTDPVKISVKVRDTAANVEQDIVHAPNEKTAKLKVLIELLYQPGFDKVLVFGRTKFGVERISKALRAAGIKADSIHGDKSQNFRMKALQSFKKGELRVLVATDVAARGLDISNVSHVINYDLPANYEDYVHRIGRTGRADKKGVALTFVTTKK